MRATHFLCSNGRRFAFKPLNGLGCCLSKAVVLLLIFAPIAWGLAYIWSLFYCIFLVLQSS